MIRRSPVRRSARGGFEIRLKPDERALLSALAGQLSPTLEALRDPDATVPDVLRRLLPPAFSTDASAEAAYVRLVREDLVEHHADALATLGETASATHLDDAGLEAWLVALNDLRLVLGTALELTEEPVAPAEDDPQHGEWVCYQYLSYLAEEVVGALDASLPPPRPGADDAAPEDPWGEPLGGLRWDGTPSPPQG